MAFPSSKSQKGTKPQKGSKTSKNNVKPASPEDAMDQKKPFFSGLFKKKQHDTPLVAKEDLDAGLSRALRTPKVTTKKVENDYNDQAAVHNALGAIEATIYAMDNVAEIITQCLEIVTSAKDREELGARALLAESYDELRFSIDDVIEEVDPQAKKLIDKNAENMEIVMVGRARYSIACFQLDTSSSGLDLTPPHHAFATDEEIDESIANLHNAKTRVERTTAAYCRDAKFLMARLNDKDDDKDTAKLIKKVA